MTIIPIPQTKTVRVTSQIERVNALMYFVTVTPLTLNVAIEKIPKITKKSKAPLLKIYEKKTYGLSKYGIPS